MRIANVAVDESQVAISKEIAAQIMKRRVPVLAETSTVRNDLLPNDNQLPTETTTKAPVQALLALMHRWSEGISASDRISASECFDILMPLVLPDKHSVFLYTDQVRLLVERPNCLAVQLVECAAQAGRLNELKTILDQRTIALNWRVLRTQIAIAEGDLEKAKVLLSELHEQYQISKSMDFLTAASQVAIPSLRVDELRESALPIVEALLKREKETDNHRNVDFDQLPLVREVDEYFRARLKAQLSKP